MSLPKIQQKIFKLNQPSTGNSIQYRQFTVKEEKILLISEQSEEAEDMIDGINQILSNCVITKLDINKLPIFDAEYIFLQLRSKSVGNIVQISLLDKEDEKLHEVEINLEEIQVYFPENHKSVIDVDDKIKLELEYPNLSNLKDIVNLNPNDSDKTLKLIAGMINCVYDEEKNYDISTESEEAKIQWLESFDKAAMQQIYDFFDTLPHLKHTVTYKNSLGNEREFTFEKLSDFFL